MKFIYFSFSNIYLYSPNTFLHKLPSNYKVFIIFSSLCILPYFDFLYILYCILLILFFLIIVKIPKYYYYNNFNIFLLTCLCLLPYCLNNIHNCNYKTIIIFIPIKIKNILTGYIQKPKLQSINTKNLFFFKIPEFIAKIALISIFYSITLKTLLLTTMYENIILSLCYYINSRINNNYIKNIILISAFASQFLEQILQRIRIIYISIKLRNIHLINCNNKKYLYSYILIKFLNDLKSDIRKVSSVLYSREFNNQSFKLDYL